CALPILEGRHRDRGAEVVVLQLLVLRPHHFELFGVGVCTAFDAVLHGSRSLLVAKSGGFSSTLPGATCFPAVMLIFWTTDLHLLDFAGETILIFGSAPLLYSTRKLANYDHDLPRTARRQH